MKKLTLILISLAFCLSLASCKDNSLATTALDRKPNEQSIKEAVSKYYLAKEPKNKGELKIYNIKPFKDKYLVLADKYSGDGHKFTNLLLIDEKYNTIAWTSGETPISMCFSINKVDYDGNTILFGTFNNSKWDSKQDKKIPVEINKIDIKFDNNQNVKEAVSIENGYIVVSEHILKVKEFNLYNEKNELQSSLEELGDISSESQFNELKVK